MSQVTNPRAPSLIEYEGWRFLIVDSPTEATLAEALKVWCSLVVLVVLFVCLFVFRGRG
jgi:hypothetical protein